MSLAQVASAFSPACTWRPVMSQSHPSRPVLSWKPIILGKAVIVTHTLRNLYTRFVVFKLSNGDNSHGTCCFHPSLNVWLCPLLNKEPVQAL